MRRRKRGIRPEQDGRPSVNKRLLPWCCDSGSAATDGQRMQPGSSVQSRRCMDNTKGQMSDGTCLLCITVYVFPAVVTVLLLSAHIPPSAVFFSRRLENKPDIDVGLGF